MTAKIIFVIHKDMYIAIISYYVYMYSIGVCYYHIMCFILPSVHQLMAPSLRAVSDMLF